MGDRYQDLVTTPLGRQVADVVGLPVPEPLRRHEPGAPLAPDPVLLGAAPGGHLAEHVERVLAMARADVHRTRTDGVRYSGLVFDATGIAASDDLAALPVFFTPAIRQMGPSARLLVLGTPPEDGDRRRHVAQRALEGFVRSAGKELRRGGTANLGYVADGAEAGLDATLRFFLSGRAAYVSGQVVRLRPADVPAPPDDHERPLAGTVALVTGAAQGIGAAIARTLARDGAHVVALDVPGQGDALARLANDVGGEALQLDLTAEDAPARISGHLRDRHGGVDVVVHNAGVTRDKTLAAMDDARWRSVIEVNLASVERVTDALLDGGVLRAHPRIVCVSSVSGIAGNRGQTNYAASKAGIIGLVEALAPVVRERGGTINAVAPGFIETAMTAAMPLTIREAGRRMNSLNQGGLPVDVAETVAWLADPRSSTVNGQVVRVCGQSLLGA